ALMFRPSKRLLSARTIALFILVLVGRALPSSASDLNGIVTSSNRKPVAHAIVGVHRSSIDGPLPTTESHGAITNADGTFTVKNLNDGPYVICVLAPGEELLDPCQWSRPLPIFRLPITSKTQITLERGTTIKMRLDDPERLLPTEKNPRPGVVVEPGVRT